MRFEQLDPESYSLVDLNPLLPDRWAEEVLALAQDAPEVNIRPSSTSRHDEDRTFKMRTLNGNILNKKLPWLFGLYESVFADIVGAGLRQVVCTASNAEYAVIMNVIGRHDDPYEPHVDSNGATLVLPVTTHGQGEGGELVISKNPYSVGFFDPNDKDSLQIAIETGRGIIFCGTDMPHYVQIPSGKDRVTLLFNYYTKDANEGRRPSELSKAIGLHENGPQL